MSPTSRIALLGTALVTLIGACAPVAASPPTKPQATTPPTTTTAAPAPAALRPLSPPVTVRIGEHGVVSNAPVYVALERGYYQEQGLKVELVPFSTGPVMMAPLASNQLEVAVGAPGAALFNAIARDIPLRIVADKGSKSFNGQSYSALIARRDLVESGALADYADLRGRRVANPAAGSGNEIQLLSALRKGGLTLADVDRQLLGQPDMLLALANRNLDAAMVLEPFVARAVEQGHSVRWKGAEDFHPSLEQGLVYYGPGFIADHPEAGRRFMVAFVQGVRDYLDAFEKGTRKAETIAMLQRYTEVKDAATYERMVPAGIDRNGYVDVADLEEQQEYYIQAGYQQQAVNMREVVDHQFVEYALDVLGRAP